MRRAALATLLVLAAPPVLGGCVAAVIPLAAGGALIGKEELGLDKRNRQSTDVTNEQSSEQAREQPSQTPPAVVTPPVTEQEAPLAQAPELAGTADGNAAVDAPAMELDIAPATDDGTAQELPPATSAPSAPAAPPLARRGVASPNIASPGTPAGDPRAYDALYAYVDQQARRDPVDAPRQSALLQAPGTLSPVRTICSIRPPAVLIDLDPADGTFDPEMAPAPNPALAQMIASLRLQEVDIFWISSLAAVRAGGVRKALVESGLDPAGRDGLLLMRKIDDRKQIRRRELGDTHCVVAIAGDNRTDFDELYLYLKDASAAQPLEELIGAGWFLTPLPLSEGHTP